MDTPIFDGSIASLRTLNFHAVSTYIFLVLPLNIDLLLITIETPLITVEIWPDLSKFASATRFCAPHCALAFAKMVKSGTGISIYIFISLIAKFISSNYI